MKLVLSWMRDFVAVPAGEDAGAVAARLAACGFEVAGIVEGAEPVIDFEITANRPDCLSVVGLAREAAVAYGAPWQAGAQDSKRAVAVEGPAIDVVIEDPELCPRYAAQVARVTIAPSPGWMQQRLVAAGVRPINNIVDITNYVMLERGHPLHAFDLDKLAGRKIVVRRARPGEKLRTLDGVDRALERDMLVIADAERAAAVAGVMGGADSEVSLGTTAIALESAWFLPRSVRVTSRRLGLKTEASARFERGADIEAPLQALARVMGLMRETGAGEPVGPVVDRYPARAEPRRIMLRSERIARLLGAPVPDADVERILAALGFAVEDGGGTRAWNVTVPSWRVDAAREADLIEEVARHFGYDKLPMTFPVLRDVAPAPDPRIDRDRLVRRALNACGLAEVVTFTFVERKAAEPFASAAAPAVAIANPLSEKFAVLRPSLLPGLVDAVAHNRRHGRADVRLFEIGCCFSAAAGEQRRVGLAWTGRATPEHWSQPSRPADFFDARGVVETLGDALGRTLSFAPATREYLVAGRTAGIDADGVALGVVGQLQPAIGEARDVPGDDEIYVAELDLDALAASTPTLERMEPLPRFPSVGRDLSILVSDRLPAAEVRGTIRTAAPSTLVDLREFDRYQGPGIPEGRVSLSWHLTFRSPERTLTDAEVDGAMGAIMRALETAHGAVRR